MTISDVLIQIELPEFTISDVLAYWIQSIHGF